MSLRKGHASNQKLNYLIYQYLKENGFQKAAEELKKHVKKVAISIMFLVLTSEYVFKEGACFK
jgi:hypothetical protein